MSEKCIACKSALKEGAKLCVPCGTYQDFRRYLALGNVSLTLLIALISVFTVFISSLDKNLVKDEDVTISVVEVKAQKIIVSIANSGEKSASFSPELGISLKTEKTFPLEIYSNPAQASMDLLLKPGEVQVMTAHMPDARRFTRISEDYCQLTLKYVDIKGREKFVDTKTPCKIVKKA